MKESVLGSTQTQIININAKNIPMIKDKLNYEELALQKQKYSNHTKLIKQKDKSKENLASDTEQTTGNFKSN